jgi:hypothetical protein
MSLAVLGTIVTTIAPWLGEWAIVGLAGKLGEGAVKRFKPDEMALLLKQSIATAEDKQPPTGALFDRCHHDGYKGVRQFLEQFFQLCVKNRKNRRSEIAPLLEFQLRKSLI